jgi:hypothetical protein
MRSLYAVVAVSVFCVGAAAAAPPRSKIAPVARRGDTVLTARSVGLNVRVVITTAATSRAAAQWDPKFYAPKSWVENLVINVNGSNIFMPLSAFLDLFDLREAEVRLEEKTGVLLVRGGDASESYWAGIEFDTENVTRRRLGPSVPEGTVTQETTYRLVEQ